MSKEQFATGERSRLLLALDRMIESVQEDINLEDVGNYATISALVGEKKGLSTARELAERCALSETPRSAVVESLIGQLRKHVSHNVCEDAWYSCSQADCADDRRAGHPCDCGAQHLNELHAHAADALERTVSAIPRSAPAGTRVAMRNKDCQGEPLADDATKEAVFVKLLEFFNEHRCWSGESYYQSDGPQIGAQELMGDILDLLDAKVVYD